MKSLGERPKPRDTVSRTRDSNMAVGSRKQVSLRGLLGPKL